MVLDNMQGPRDGPGASEPRERRVLTRVVQLGSPVAPSRPGTEQGHRAFPGTAVTGAPQTGEIQTTDACVSSGGRKSEARAPAGPVLLVLFQILAAAGRSWCPLSLGAHGLLARVAPPLCVLSFSYKDSVALD